MTRRVPVRRSIPVALLLWAALAAIGQTTFYVDGRCGDDTWAGLSPLCVAPDGPMRTIQAGIDVSRTGDTVIVENGTYIGSGNSNLDYGGRLIAVRSANGAPNCIIDCQGVGRGFHFQSGETPEAILEGFTILNGEGLLIGGGVLCEQQSSPTILRCVFLGHGEWGAVWIDHSDPIVSKCTFAGNKRALLNSDANVVIAECTFTGNVMADSRSSASAAINSLRSDVIVRDCVFFGNQQSNSRILTSGGAMRHQTSNVVVTRCVFVDNKADCAAGIFSIDSWTTVTHCLFAGNQAFECGAGAISSLLDRAVTIENCLFLGNVALSAGTGGAILNRTENAVSVRNCTFSGNFAADGGAIASRGSANNLTVTNSTFWNDVPNEIVDENGPVTTVTYSNVQGGWSGAGSNNIAVAPRFRGGPFGVWSAAAVFDPAEQRTTFTDSAGNWSADELKGKLLNPNTSQFRQLPIVGNSPTEIVVSGDVASLGPVGGAYRVYDYHFLHDSPCVDAGDPGFVSAPGATDMDGQLRVWNGRVDMGADEFGSFVFGDVNCDGAFDGGDIDPFFLALGDPPTYASQFPNCDPLLGDMNADGRLDGGDIDPFFQCLGGAVCP